MNTAYLGRCRNNKERLVGGKGWEIVLVGFCGIDLFHADLNFHAK